MEGLNHFKAFLYCEWHLSNVPLPQVEGFSIIFTTILLTTRRVSE